MDGTNEITNYEAFNLGHCGEGKIEILESNVVSVPINKGNFISTEIKEGADAEIRIGSNIYYFKRKYWFI